MWPFKYFAEASRQAKHATAPTISPMPVRRNWRSLPLPACGERACPGLDPGSTAEGRRVRGRLRKERTRIGPLTPTLSPPAGRGRARDRSIGRPSAGNVEHRPGGEGALGRGAEGGERRHLVDLDEPPALDFRQHVGD